MRELLKCAILCLCALPHFLDAQVVVRAVEELRSNDSSGLEFTTIGNIVLDREGSAYISQPADGNIKVLNHEGGLIRTIGRKGAGPGEFALNGRMGWIGDTLWVADRQAKRISLFALGAKFSSSFSGIVDLEDFPMRPTPPTALLANGQSFVIPDFARGTPKNPFKLESVPLLLATREGTVLDTIAEVRVAHTAMRIEINPAKAQALVGRQPFSDDPLWAVSPQGDILVVVDRTVGSHGPHHFSVTRYSVGAHEKIRRAFEYSPTTFTRSERDAFIDARVDDMVERSRGAFDRGRLREEYHNALFVPPYHVPIEGVVVDWNGRVWLAKQRAPGAKQQMWLVLDRMNNPLWKVSLPSDIRLWTSRGTEVWGSGLDEFDVPYVVRFRILTSAEEEK